MDTEPTSLDQLHDLAPPPEVSWWPLAPGWYVVLAVLSIVILFALYRVWKNWQANAYRRAALRELNDLDSATAIAELLRRTALAIAPRSVISKSTGADWIAWLSAQCPDAMPKAVSTQLTQGIYSRTPDGDSIEPLREYASHWITSHQITPHSSSS